MKCRSNSDVDAILKTRAKAPALPKPTGKVVRVTTIEEFKKALQTVESGSTVLLADGTYRTGSLLLQDRERITIRSESGSREKVILDGEGMAVKGKRHWALALHGTPDFTIADITMRNFDYGVYIFGDGNVQRPLIHNMKFQNIWVRGVKGTHAQRVWDHGKDNVLSPEQTEKVRPHDGRIQYCLFVNDRAKENIHDGFDGDYNRRPRFINNLVHGRMYMQDGVEQLSNIVGDLAGRFVDPAIGDLRLDGKADDAIGKAVPLREVREDIDRQPRKAKPTIGAAEKHM